MLEPWKYLKELQNSTKNGHSNLLSPPRIVPTIDSPSLGRKSAYSNSSIDENHYGEYHNNLPLLSLQLIIHNSWLLPKLCRDLD